MIEKCFNCGEDIDNEVDVYSQLVGSAYDEEAEEMEIKMEFQEEDKYEN